MLSSFSIMLFLAFGAMNAVRAAPLRNRGSISGRHFFSSCRPDRPVMGPSQPCIQRGPEALPAGGRGEADRSLSPSVNVHMPSWCVAELRRRRDNSTYRLHNYILLWRHNPNRV